MLVKSQHFVPVVYLRRFRIDNVDNKGVVFVFDYSNRYQYRPLKKGVGAKLFIGEYYYNDDSLLNPSAIDEIIKTEFEDKYDSIINDINKEQPLEAETFNNIIGWLWVSKFRSPYYRAMANTFLNSSNNSTETNGIKEGPVNQSPQSLHTSLFYKKDQLDFFKNVFAPSLLSKKWRFLKSSNEKPFITSDNPGFTWLNPLFDHTSFSPIIGAGPNAVIYYVLSPTYCVEISPFKYGVSVKHEDILVNIPYYNAPENLINVINSGAYFTKENLLIFNLENSLLTINEKYKNYNLHKQYMNPESISPRFASQ